MTVKNLARLQRKLKRFPAVAEAHIKTAMEAVAAEIVAMMKGLVAVDDGTLRDSIGWTWGDAPKGSVIVAKAKGGDGRLTLTIYAGSTEAYYARWVEFGTSPHLNGGKFKGTANPGTNAQPFFYVSWRASRKAARRKMNKAIRDSAKQVAGAS